MIHSTRKFGKQRNRAKVMAARLAVFVMTVAILSVPVLRTGIYFLAWRIYADAPVEKRFAVSGDARISYTTYGAGPPLVLLHGGLSSSLDWIGEIPAFSRYYKVIVLDLRGHAESTLGNEAFTYRLLASDVAVVLDDLGIERSSIAGWSDGGNVGLLFALNYPTRIERLIAISANFHPDGVADEVMQQIVDAPDRAGSLVARWLYHFRSPSPENWPKLQRRVTQMWQSRPTLTVEDLKSISAPTLLIVGARDDIDREHSEAMAAAIPKAELIIVPRVGHAVPRNAPSIVTENALRFLSGT
jgi:pimeloyl-ACP methyl ester carboxylesterase